jgi:hypothetical protein
MFFKLQWLWYGGSKYCGRKEVEAAVAYLKVISEYTIYLDELRKNMKVLKRGVLVQTTSFVQQEPDKFAAKCAVINLKGEAGSR